MVFRYLSKLNSVLLYNTKLDTLPNNFGKLKNLKSLTIVKCGFSRVQKPICDLSSLETLVLDNNDIGELPQCLYQLKNLKYLSLRSNNLSSLSDHVSFLQNLDVLDLRGNFFKEYDVKVLEILLPNCRILY